VTDNSVYVIQCPEYEQVPKRLPELIELMGGIGRFVSPGERLAIKPNLLLEARPEEAVTTHPKVVSTLGHLVTRAGAQGIIVDSPGSGVRYTRKVLENIYKRSGLAEAAQESGVELNMDTSFETVSYSEGKFIKRFEIITPILESDGVLNLSKLKTHCFTYFTGAIKNNFGVIPGRAKPGYHQKLNDRSHFVRMLLDLARLVSPRLSIMDAVVAMEGDGPTAGSPRKIGLLLGARNPLALDVVASEIIGLDREKNPFLQEAEKMGLFPNDIHQVEVIGAEIPKIRIENFRFPVTMFSGTGFGDHLNWWQRLIEPIFKDALTLKPRVRKETCKACGSCLKSCPADAITIQNTGNKPCAQIDDTTCIRCYCCHEMCQEKAIRLQKSLLYRFSNR
jgi:uncharacterized protein (DUF362 family)/Pyruvate/2-oxoacid:ferredoxin oxidoreductase delta subunit